MSLIDHARHELDLIGEDDDTKIGLLNVVQAFADCGHSGGSAPFAIAYLERLLRFQPLSDLTDDRAEWMHVSDDAAGRPDLWQSRRNPEAFSTDGGKTYTLLSERQAAGDDVVPLHRSVQS